VPPPQKTLLPVPAASTFGHTCLARTPKPHERLTPLRNTKPNCTTKKKKRTSYVGGGTPLSYILRSSPTTRPMQSRQKVWPHGRDRGLLRTDKQTGHAAQSFRRRRMSSHAFAILRTRSVGAPAVYSDESLFNRCTRTGVRELWTLPWRNTGVQNDCSSVQFVCCEQAFIRTRQTQTERRSLTVSPQQMYTAVANC